RHGIPYVTSSGTGFFDREEVKDVLALLRLVVDPMDDAALVRVLQGPVVRMDDAAMYGLASRRFERRGMRLRDCLDAAAAEGWPELEAGVSRRVRHALQVTDELGRARDGLTVADVLNRLLERSGYLRHCQLRARREGPRPVMNVRKVFDMASGFERDAALAGIGDFVAHLDRIIDTHLPVGEPRPEEIDVEEDDHFAEILNWALNHPEAARVVQAEQLELPGAANGRQSNGAAFQDLDVDAVIARMERLRAGAPDANPIGATRASPS